MSINFQSMLHDLDYQEIIDRAIKEISPFAAKSYKEHKHLVRNVNITTHLLDEESGEKEGIQIAFELQNPTPMELEMNGVMQKVFIRQFVHFIPSHLLPYKKFSAKRSILNFIKRFTTSK